jgi:hypothetical protein
LADLTSMRATASTTPSPDRALRIILMPADSRNK